MIDLRATTGVRLASDTWGEADAPTVLLLHGAGQTRHAWRATGQHLVDAGFRAVTLDLRGHGDSDWDPCGDYSTEALVADVAAVIAGLGTKPAIVGASLGGSVGLLLAGRPEPLCSALVLVDMVPRLELEGVDRVMSFMTGSPEGFGSLEDAAETIARYLPHRPRPRSLDGLSKNLRRSTDGRYHWHWDPRFMSDTSRALRRDEHFAAARRLTVPTLLVRGQMSDVVSAEGAEEFLLLAPHAEFVDVSGASHMVAGDDNDVFADAVTHFLHRAIFKQE